MESNKALKQMFGAAMAACAPLAAEAQQLFDRWQCRARIYAWLPDIGCNTTFPAGNGSISVDANQIFSNLKFTFMGTFEAQKGPWGVFTDVVYVDIDGKGRLAFGDNRERFVPYYSDVGTGQTDLTRQFIGGLGYAFKWGEVIAV